MREVFWNYFKLMTHFKRVLKQKGWLTGKEFLQDSSMNSPYFSMNGISLALSLLNNLYSIHLRMTTLMIFFSVAIVQERGCLPPYLERMHPVPTVITFFPSHHLQELKHDKGSHLQVFYCSGLDHGNTTSSRYRHSLPL